MNSLVSFLSVSYFGNLFALLIVLIFCSILYRVQKDEGHPIDFRDLFLDKKTGKIGGSEFRINTAFIVTTWALIYLTIKGSLTEWFLVAYLGAFVVDRIFSRKSSNAKENSEKTVGTIDASGSRNEEDPEEIQ